MHAIVIFLKLLIKASKSYFKFRVIVQQIVLPEMANPNDQAGNAEEEEFMKCSVSLNSGSLISPFHRCRHV